MFCRTKRMRCLHLSQMRVFRQEFVIYLISQTLHPCYLCVLALPSHSVLCGATFTMRAPSQTVYNCKTCMIRRLSHTFTFPTPCAIWCKSAYSCSYKTICEAWIYLTRCSTYNRLRYIKCTKWFIHSTRMEWRPIARVLLWANVYEAYDIINSS
jgi:hypothetical protein